MGALSWGWKSWGVEAKLGRHKEQREKRCKGTPISVLAGRIKSMQEGREGLPRLDLRACRMPGKFR